MVGHPISVVAIGDGCRREGAKTRSAPPSAFARFGQASWIVPPARVEHPERIEVGASVVLLEGGALLAGEEGGITLGDGVRLSPFTTIVGRLGVVLEEEVAGSDGVVIFDSYPGADPPFAPGPVVVEAGAYLGFNAVLCPGVRVGRGAFVGEGAVVMEDVAAHTVVAGNPARVTRRFDPASGAWLDR